MTIREPQRDLPIGLRGGADTWDQPQASAVLASEWFARTTLRRWSGSAWVPAILRRWSGSAWVPVILRRWSGSAWV